MLIKLAWRNIWRNKRRTLITASSIAFAVLFSGFMSAIQEGSWDHMINNIVSSYTGNIQIHKKGYWESPSINELMPYDDLKQYGSSSENIKISVPRLESFALLSTGENTRGTMIVGIQPLLENSFSQMAEKVVEGNFLIENDKGVLLGDRLSELIDAKVGDTIVLISQGYRGANAAGKYPIRGMVHFPIPQQNRSLVILSLREAQAFYGAEGLISALVLKTFPMDVENLVISKATSSFDTATYEMMSYKELMPDLIKSKQIDASGNYIIFFVLYMIIAFGIFGTILMMLKERQYEFGVLVSIGMEKFKLFIMVWWELLILASIGIIAGLVFAYAFSYYFHVNPIVLTGDFADAMEKFEFDPIMPASIKPSLFIQQAIIVYLICTVIIIFPYFHIRKLKPTKAMRE
jgi:ABC-type lipoprotein release transport system permease subunit